MAAGQGTTGAYRTVEQMVDDGWRVQLWRRGDVVVAEAVRGNSTVNVESTGDCREATRLLAEALGETR